MRDGNVELADFLKSRRDRIRPEDVGLSVHGRRRVRGLRRAEVAQLAGISPEYYMRLEQGRSNRPSRSVVDALAEVFRLDEDEREHLYLIARSEVVARSGGAGGVDDGVQRLLESVDPVPAYVLNARLDVLAWNRMAAALVMDFAELPAGRRNLVWFAFCEDRARDFYVHWERMAMQGIAHLRAALGRAPDDPDTNALIEDISARSKQFRDWWSRHEVRGPGSGVKEFRHPLVGRMTLNYNALLLPGGGDQQLVMYTAPEGSTSQNALDLLAVIGSEKFGDASDVGSA
ncbi:helix-turn-helix domain-containing protein [Saccharopolyspora erythraea]|uniref:helix-turn-helix transcriptional regulator n=1 Tax=Saccharopolyspora erythraea TaxID=1836 RepID=UPI001BAAD69B|nr:helix-turn-helix transcriptional regulator [Saccharopolyspora erythraea]QUH02160.1 helix-turn-helix domain-containing protein [Saccharopolyspora erythraea]